MQTMAGANPVRRCFGEPELERQFRRTYHEHHQFQNRLAAVLGLVVYVLFALLDRAVGGDRWQELWTIRLGITLPPLALVLGGFFVPRIAHRYGGPLAAAALLIAGLGIVAMNARLPLDVQNLYFSGLLVTIVFIHALLRVDFRWVVGAAALLFVAYLAVAGILAPIPTHHLIASVFYYLSIEGVMAYTDWLLERQERESFLLHDQLHTQAHTDELTGLANRRAFFGHLKSEWRRALRDGTPLTLLLVDLDHLKAINDSAGHAGGDEALRRLAAALRPQARRPGDLAARLGGDEFALLLSGASPKRADQIARRLSQGFATLPACGNLPARRLTASIGLVTAVPTPVTTHEDLISAADKALYEAKTGGRARAVRKALR